MSKIMTYMPRAEVSCVGIWASAPVAAAIARTADEARILRDDLVDKVKTWTRKKYEWWVKGITLSSIYNLPLPSLSLTSPSKTLKTSRKTLKFYFLYTARTSPLRHIPFRVGNSGNYPKWR
jgi:hypothetical protein